MKISFLFLILLISSCSNLTKKDPPKDQPVQITESQIEECLHYQTNVLEKAYQEVKGKKSEEFAFTKDVKEAQDLLKKFDPSKGLAREKSISVANILNYCTEERVKKFDESHNSFGRCSLMFSELNYFQSLALALNKYQWPTMLKLEAKKIAIDYVRYYSEDTYPLLNRLIALSVLDELSVNKVVNQNLHIEIKNLMQESRIYVEGLRLKLNKDPGISCASLSIIRDELYYSNQIAQKIKDLLTRI
jgi:Rad3-related DNA helicase